MINQVEGRLPQSIFNEKNDGNDSFLIFARFYKEIQQYVDTS